MYDAMHFAKTKNKNRICNIMKELCQMMLKELCQMMLNELCQMMLKGKKLHIYYIDVSARNQIVKKTKLAYKHGA